MAKAPMKRKPYSCAFWVVLAYGGNGTPYVLDDGEQWQYGSRKSAVAEAKVRRKDHPNCRVAKIVAREETR